MITLRRLSVLAALAWLAGAGPHHAHAEVRSADDPRDTEPLAIVVNKGNPIDNMSLADLRRLYRGQRTRWPNGRRVTVLMRDPGTAERISLLRRLYGMREEEYRRTILQAMFAGQASDVPRNLSTTNGVLRFVFNAPGAIGYVRHSEVDGTVKVLRLDGHFPVENGYPLEVALP